MDSQIKSNGGTQEAGRSSLHEVLAGTIRDLKDENSELKAQNRVMRDALIEITGIRIWHCSADYSAKTVAQQALRRAS